MERWGRLGWTVVVGERALLFWKPEATPIGVSDARWRRRKGFML